MAKQKKPKFNHAYTIAFEVSGSKDENGKDVTGKRLRSAIKQRLKSLTDEELADACEAPFDTHQE
jgi:hypothetical protein